MRHVSLPGNLMLGAAALLSLCWLSLVIFMRFVPASSRRWLMRGAVAVTALAVIAVTAAMIFR